MTKRIRIAAFACAVLGLVSCTAVLGSFDVVSGGADAGPTVDSSSGGVDSNAQKPDTSVPDANNPVDAGSDAKDAAVDVAPDANATFACATSTGIEENFGNGRVWGCPGTVDYASRATLCKAGCIVATADRWNTYHGAAIPAHHYWVDDPLFYGGNFPGANEGDCFAGPAEVNNCGAATPMRVCKPNVYPTGGSTDPEGNQCNWYSCQYSGGGKHYYGGCAGNTTAGTLCACP
jgi:hypothetical protein